MVPRSTKGKKKVTQDQAIEFDRALQRFQFRDKLLRILEHIFFIDVYMGVASVGGGAQVRVSGGVSGRGYLLEIERSISSSFG